MITDQIKRFMAVEPLMMPTLLFERNKEEVQLTNEMAILHFHLDERYPLSYLNKVLEEEVELIPLLQTSNEENPKVKHDSFFPKPQVGRTMFLLSFTSDELGFVDLIEIRIFESIDIWEYNLEQELTTHQEDWIHSYQMTQSEILSLFC